MAKVTFNDKDPDNRTLTTGDVNALKNAINENEGFIGTCAVSGVFDSNLDFRYNYHCIPKLNAQYDLGNAEYKIRHLFLSDNSLWIGDENKIEASSGEVKTKKRNKDVLPFYITGEAMLNKTAADVLGAVGKASVSDITLSELEEYAQSIDPNATLDNIYPREDDVNYYPADFKNIFEQNDHIGRTPLNFTNDGSTPTVINILEGNVIHFNNDNKDTLTLDIHGLTEESFSKGQVTLYAEGTTSSTSVVINVNKKPSTLRGVPALFGDRIQILTIDLLYHDGIWNHFITLK